MAGVFDEASDTDGLDLIEEVEANGGEYEIIPDGPAEETTNQGPDPAGTPEEAQTSGRPRNPDGTFAPRDRAPQQAQPQAPQQQEQQNRVPISAIQEERRKRQELERRLGEREREWAAVQERVRIFQEQQAMESRRRAEAEQAAQEQARTPDPTEDPLGYARYMVEKQQREIELLRQAQQATYGDFQRQQQQNAHAALLSDIGQQVQHLQTQFAMQNPDYPSAFAHLAQTRYNELSMMGYSDEQIPQILEQERSMIVTGCLEADPVTNRPRFRDNPARVAYELAKARGYGAAPQAPAQMAPPQQQPMQQYPPPEAQRVQQMQQRVNQAGRVGGHNPTEAPLSLEQIAKMSEDEFGRLMASDEALVDALMGSRY